jgi:hypothetical protein
MSRIIIPFTPYNAGYSYDTKKQLVEKTATGSSAGSRLD